MRRPGRLHAPEVLATLTTGGDGQLELRAPAPGLFTPELGAGELVAAGTLIGELAVLGRGFAVLAPPQTPKGIVVRIPTRAAHSVGYGDALVTLDPSLQLGDAAAAGGAGAAAPFAVDGLVFRAPTSGRFYGRSAPDKPPFVVEGAELTAGVTICLLEVMKTFHRVTYGGPDLPDAARIRKILVVDGADVNAGDPLLALDERA
jgi:acetyl-CoA carboxylase biotin carboxyl carrier protein